MSEAVTDFIFKFIRFGLVGVSGVGIDFGLTYFTKEKLGLQKYLANAIGFCSAATSNFILNRWWTFSEANPDVNSQFIKFFLIALAGLSINTGILWYAHQKKGLNFFLAKAIAIMMVMFWNFLMNFFFTFS